MVDDGRVRVAVGSRVRVFKPDVPAHLLDELRALFEHKNPQAEKLRRMGIRFDPRREPKVIRTWRDEPPWLSLPRGGTKRLRELLDSSQLRPLFKDERTEGEDAVLDGFEWPTYKRVLFPDQEDALAAMLRMETCYLRAPTGCLAGYSILNVNRAGKGFRMRLADFVFAFNGGRIHGRAWQADIHTFVRAPFPDGLVHLARVISAKESGVREVYRVQLAPWTKGPIGRATLARTQSAILDATVEHEFLTPFGWRALECLSVGDDVLVDAGMGGTLPRSKPWYRLKTLREHPFVGRRGVKPSKGGWTVPLHRLVAESRENGLSLEAFIGRVRAGDRSLRFLDPKVWVVHHKDENTSNNASENLEVMTHAEHQQRHRGLAIANIASRLVATKILSIEYVGERETFDIEVERASAFIANGVAVHNSGKTEVGLAAIARIRRPAIVVVWTGALFDQWLERVRDGLGIREGQIGQVRGGRKTVGPVTVAMQQTLAKFDPTDLFFRFFGVVVADELQRFSAPTFVGSIDPFPARYRFGISADERRADRKEFLVYDLFGEMARDVDRKELVEKGRVRDVEIRVVPTGWPYALDRAIPAGEAYRLMLDAMSDVSDRDAHVLRIVQAERERGEQVLVFSLRVEHCRKLVGMLQKEGINAGLMLGGTENKAALEDAVKGMRAGTMRAAVGTVQAVGTGVDLPRVGVGIVAQPVAGNRQLLGQVAGRVCRVAGGEGAARLYYLADACREKDWAGLFDDGRPVSVMDARGEWIDARHDRRAAKERVFPKRAPVYEGFKGDDRWRTR